MSSDDDRKHTHRIRANFLVAYRGRAIHFGAHRRGVVLPDQRYPLTETVYGTHEEVRQEGGGTEAGREEGGTEKGRQESRSQVDRQEVGCEEVAREEGRKEGNEEVDREEVNGEEDR